MRFFEEFLYHYRNMRLPFSLKAPAVVTKTYNPGVIVTPGGGPPKPYNGTNGNGGLANPVHVPGANVYRFGDQGANRLSDNELVSRFDRCMMRTFREPVVGRQAYYELLDALTTQFLDQLGVEHRRWRGDYERVIKGYLDANNFYEHVYCVTEDDPDVPVSGGNGTSSYPYGH